jgi:GT2 family glycosyltransferase
MADVRVGIVSWNTAALLDACLSALPEALGGLDAEIVVVDNDSADGSAAVASAHPGVRVVANDTNVGYARAMNQALAGTSAPTLIALNPDTVPPPGSLATLVARLAAQPDAAIVVPRLLDVDGALQPSCQRFPSIAVALAVALLPPRAKRSAIGAHWWLEGSVDHRQRVPVDWAIGAVHVIRASALCGEPPYNERWFMYVEDIELCWRLRRRGMQTRLEGDVAVTHVGNASGAQAWGGDRARRFWIATYDFLTSARGARYARTLAAVNAVAVVWLAAAYRAAALLPGPRRAMRLAISRDLRAALPAHLAVARRGAPPGGLPGPGDQPA